MAKVLGIDLGTTNSWMAVIDGSEPAVLENSEGNPERGLNRAALRKAASRTKARLSTLRLWLKGTLRSGPREPFLTIISNDLRLRKARV